MAMDGLRYVSGEYVTQSDLATAGGLVLITTQSFSAVQNMSVNNCFSADYDNYRIMISAGSAGIGDLTCRLRASGADSTASRYYVRFSSVPFNAGTIGTDGNTDSATSWYLGRTTSAANQTWTLDMANPFATLAASIHVLGLDAKSYSTAGGGIFDSTTSCDGFSVLCSSNMTGTLSVYGYRNS